MIKQCSLCKEIKSLDKFSKNARSPIGKCPQCKDCQREYYKKNKQECIDRATQYSLKHKQAFNNHDTSDKKTLDWITGQLYHGSLQRAKKHNVEHTIKRSDIIVPLTCPILEIPLRRGTDTNDMYSPSLDRIDNSKGYVPGNVQVISNLANCIKTSATGDQIMKVAQWMLKNGL